MGRPKSYFLWISWHIVRALFVALIAFICIFLGWRMVFSKRPAKEMRTISDNALLSEAYEAYGKISVMEQPNEVRYTEGEDNYADYHVGWCVFLEEADQVQLLFLYNNSTLRDVSEKLKIDPALPRGEEVFGVELLMLIDVSPEGHEGDPVIEERVIRASSCEMDQNRLYTFGRYTFDGVDINEAVKVVYLDIYYENGARTELGTMRLYHAESTAAYRSLTAKEESIIKE